ncbi:MAG: PilT/PilU family type 4a pilus ATPase [Erysipelotrichaceae bacterium]|nr:PilT/PilU family type 4a pilus ATPase [Erysipelotrichaceae bacterium]
MKLDDILQQARLKGCSDVHISTGTGIMYRLNGQLSDMPCDLSPMELEALVINSANERCQNLLKDKRDADYVYIDNLNNRYRVNVYYAQDKINAAFRIINDNIKTLMELNLPPLLNRLAMAPRGLVLVTGPTGSGKSTTLAAMIDYINENRSCHILTIEDPIEYLYQKKKAMVHQREIFDDVSGFDEALKSAMREDPDVILVGEMRDYETIAAAITLAETGHLVLSTIHTSGAARTIDRIIDVFPPHRQNQIRSQLAGILNAVVTQTLVPTIDNHSRVPALEILVATGAVKTMIRDNKIHQILNVMATGSDFGMITLDNALANLVKEGRVSQAAAQEQAINVRDFTTFLNG